MPDWIVFAAWIAGTTAIFLLGVLAASVFGVFWMLGRMSTNDFEVDLPDLDRDSEQETP